MNSVAFCIKTFERPEAVKRLVDSIYEHYPEARIYVADDSKKPVDISGTTHLPMKYDSGLSAGRNHLVQRTKEPYLLFLDDDFVFTKMTRVEKFREFLEAEPDYGIAGGVLLENGNIRHFEGKLHLEGDTLRYERMVDTKDVDIVFNFFLARREVFDHIMWDEKKKLAEHSIRGDQPVTIRRFGEHIDVLPISDLFSPSRRKNMKENDRQHFDNGSAEVWTEDGWKRIKAVSVHVCKEKMAYVRSLDSLVECTEHHSLVINGESKKPVDIGVGGKVESNGTPVISGVISVNSEWAWLLGFFLAEGCSAKNTNDVSITNKKLDELERCQAAFHSFGIDANIVNTAERRDGCCFLKVRQSARWKNIFDAFYTADRFKKVPDFVFRWDQPSRKMFVEGFLAGDGGHRSDGLIDFAQKSAVAAQGIIQLSKESYPFHTVGKNSNEFGEWYKIYLYKKKGKMTKVRDAVTHLNFYDYEGLVYDIEVDGDLHTFSAGIGNMNVHNTDFFLSFKDAPYKVAYLPDVIVEHRPERPGNYAAYRNRAQSYLPLTMEERGIKHVIHFDGRLQDF